MAPACQARSDLAHRTAHCYSLEPNRQRGGVLGRVSPPNQGLGTFSPCPACFLLATLVRPLHVAQKQGKRAGNKRINPVQLPASGSPYDGAAQAREVSRNKLPFA